MAKVKKCVIVSGAPDPDYAFIKNNIERGRFIIAADSGFKALEKINIAPDLIIGDFDSSKKPEAFCKIITLPCEKAYADTFECILYAVKNGFKDILVLNAIGSRVDHTYSNILSLGYCCKNGVNCVILNKNNRISVIKGKKTINKEYDNFSLFAFLEDCRGVSITGAKYTAEFYNKDKIDILLGDQFGQSNCVTGNDCIVTVDEGTLLLIESND